MCNGKSGHINKFNFSLCIASSAVCVLQTFRHLIQNSQQHQKPPFSQSTFHQNNEIYSARAINIFILPKLFTYSDICDIWWNLELFYPVVKLGGQIIEFCIYTNLLIATNWNVTYIFSFREIVNQLGNGVASKTGEFLEKFQTAFDPHPPHLQKIILQFIIFNCRLKSPVSRSKMCDISFWIKIAPHTFGTFPKINLLSRRHPSLNMISKYPPKAQ